MTITELKHSSTILKALGSFNRLQIVTLLLTGEKNVSELNKTVKISQPALSQSLSKLKLAGILGSRREARQIFYYLKEPKILRIIGVCKEIVVGDDGEIRKKA